MSNDLQLNELKESFFAQVEQFVNDLDIQVFKQIIEQPALFITQNDKIVSVRRKEEPDNLNEKLNFLNIRKNTKELVLKLCILKCKSYLNELPNFTHQSNSCDSDETEESLSSVLNHLYETCYQSNPYWELNEAKNKLSLRFEQKTKRQSSLKSSGSYYTPYKFAKFMAQVAIQNIIQKKKELIANSFSELEKYSLGVDETFLIHKFKRILAVKILDPGLGSGIFFYFLIPELVIYFKEIRAFILKSFAQLNPNSKINDSFESIKKIIPFINVPDATQLKCIQESHLTQQILDFIVNECIYGIDIDDKAIQLSKILLQMRIQELFYLKDCNYMDKFHFYLQNTIISVKERPKDKEFIDSINGLGGIIWEDLIPSVFDRKHTENPDLNGFDIIIGNPPWEILKMNDREFFSDYDSQFQTYPRKKQDIVKETLLQNHISLKEDYTNKCEKIEEQLDFIKSFGFYSFQSAILDGITESGDPQLYKFYLELCFNILSSNGALIFLVQHNFLGSRGCAGLRKLYLTNGEFKGIWEFRNKLNNKLVFLNVDPNQRFIIFSYTKTNNKAQSIFYKRCSNFLELTENFKDYNSISTKIIEQFSNEELHFFTFTSQHHKNIFTKMMNHKRLEHGLFTNTNQIPIILKQDLHVTKHRKSITNTKPTEPYIPVIPVLGGKNITLFKTNHEQNKFFIGKIDNPKLELSVECIVCRNILPNSAKRLLFSLVPPNMLVDNSCTRIIPKLNLNSNHQNERNILYYLLAVLNSLAVEFFVKIFLTGINLNYYILKKIPIPAFNSNDESTKKIVDNTEYLCLNDSDTPLWAKKYMENEILIGHLFHFTKAEFEEILNDYNFEKLKRTNFSGHQPFYFINQQFLSENF